jgi:CIC family chloride channel protein
VASPTTAARRVPRMDERLLLMLVGLGVGLCAGLAAFGLNHAIEAIHHALHGLRHAWWALFIPGIGAALSWIFLTQIARDRPGHGVPEVILSVTRDGGRLRFRSSFSRLVSSALTIGSGGSAGPEAPVVMSGSAIGSSIARVLRLNEQQRIVLVGCGAAAAIASIFNAPIAGMVFTLEVILGEWRRIHIAPIAIASVAGAALSRFLRGDQIPFDHGGFAIGLGEILASPGLALATALLSVLLTRLIARSHGLWQRLPVPGWLRAGLGGCLVGAIALAFPVVLGEGYTDIRTMIGGEFSAGIAIVAAAVLAKAVATSLTLGSGGSGGIFAPSLVVGAMVGLTYQRALVHLWPGLPLVNEGCFALLGMAGMVSGILQAPLTGIFLILEITGGYDVMLPLMVVSVVSSTVCQRIEHASIYFRELVMTGQLLRPGTDARVLTDLSIRELLEEDCRRVREDATLRHLVELVQTTRRNFFAVEDPLEGRFVGLLHLDDLREILFDEDLYDVVVAGEVMRPDPTTVAPDDNLRDVLHQMDQLHAFSLPVVEDGRFLGMISKATLLDQYRRELAVQTGD